MSGTRRVCQGEQQLTGESGSSPISADGAVYLLLLDATGAASIRTAAQHRFLGARRIRPRASRRRSCSRARCRTRSARASSSRTTKVFPRTGGAGTMDEFFEESCKTYIIFRVSSRPSRRCLRRSSTRRNRPSRRRRVRGSRSAESSSALSSLHERASGASWQWMASRKGLGAAPRAQKTASSDSSPVSHTSSLLLPPRVARHPRWVPGFGLTALLEDTRLCIFRSEFDAPERNR